MLQYTNSLNVLVVAQNLPTCVPHFLLREPIDDVTVIGRW